MILHFLNLDTEKYVLTDFHARPLHSFTQILLKCFSLWTTRPPQSSRLPVKLLPPNQPQSAVPFAPSKDVAFFQLDVIVNFTLAQECCRVRPPCDLAHKSPVHFFEQSLVPFALNVPMLHRVGDIGGLNQVLNHDRCLDADALANLFGRHSLFRKGRLQTLLAQIIKFPKDNSGRINY